MTVAKGDQQSGFHRGLLMEVVVAIRVAFRLKPGQRGKNRGPLAAAERAVPAPDDAQAWLGQGSRGTGGGEGGRPAPPLSPIPPTVLRTPRQAEPPRQQAGRLHLHRHTPISARNRGPASATIATPTASAAQLISSTAPASISLATLIEGWISGWSRAIKASIAELSSSSAITRAATSSTSANHTP